MSMIDPTAADAVNNPINQLKDRVGRLTAGFTRTQRMTLGIALIAIVGLVLGVSYLQSHGPTAALYTNLSSDDVGVITKKLQELGVEYELTNGGGTIEVPADQVYQLRADLSDLDLPGSGKVGYGILDSQSITASDFSQQVGFQRAMEGEMAKTIEAMDGIDAATVHLALPKDQVFALDSEKPSASVMVKTSTKLSTEEVRSIANIVASGIQDLDPERVSIADSKGNLLASPESGVNSDGTDQESLNAYQASVQSSIESMLTGAYGAGAARVTVSADLDFDETTTTKETYESPSTIPGATGAVTKTEQTKTESYTNGANSGVLGSNGSTSGSGSGDYSSDQANKDYALNRAVETTKQAPGAVRRLSVAVMVNQKLVPAADVAEIENLVRAAAGLDEANRGDLLQVSRVKFDTSTTDALKKELTAKTQTSSSSMMLFGMAGGLALLILLSAFMVMRRRKKDLKRLQEIAEQIAENEAAAARTLEAATAGNDGASVDGRFGTAEPVIGVPGAAPARAGADPQQERQEVLSELIDNQPDEVAQLLRGWLGDRRAVKR